MRLPLVAIVLALSGVALAGCIAETAPTGGSSGTPTSGPGAGSADNVSIAWADAASATIRPGASLGGYCTLNWVFTDANGTAYIGTAGHCTEEIGERVALADADPKTDPFGTVVFDSDVSAGANKLVDFSLIRLDADRIAQTNPLMLGHDGPSGAVGPDDGAAGDLVAIYGHGLVLGDNEPTRARQGVLLSSDGEQYVADMPAVPGDSGAPVLHVPTGKALGIISRFNLAGLPPSTDIGPTMPFIFGELEKAGYVVDVATE